MQPNVPTQNCPCGRVHHADIKAVFTGAGVLSRIPEAVHTLGKSRLFLLADPNTMAAAGKAVCQIAGQAGLFVSPFVFPTPRPQPNAEAVGEALMHLPADCDLILTVGSGVLNDIGKLISFYTKKPYIAVATAPSMDGYASASASMERAGLKVSLPARCADIIIGDTDILRAAPLEMLRAGLGDMLAKYVSLAEWHMASRITGEYYCENIAAWVRNALSRCTQAAEGLLCREPRAVEAVFEGLIQSGIAMAYAGVSRPASGAEHYFSHVWDMRGLAKGTPVDLHGTQCAVGTLWAVRLYEKLKTVRPSRKTALSHAAAFSYPEHAKKLQHFLGTAAEAMLALEEKEKKYDREKHAARLAVILENWDALVEIMETELPKSSELLGLMQKIGAKTSVEEHGLSKEILPMTFAAARDIRDKYVLPRLLWDLGLDEAFLEGTL